MTVKPPDDSRGCLYPEIEPFNDGYLRVSEIHEIYYEESGNPDGRPVVFVHGGPGAGCDPKARRFFDPDHPEQIHDLIDENTRLVYIESIGNPKNDVPDFQAIAKAAHSAPQTSPRA